MGCLVPSRLCGLSPRTDSSGEGLEYPATICPNIHQSGPCFLMAETTCKEYSPSRIIFLHASPPASTEFNRLQGCNRFSNYRLHSWLHWTTDRTQHIPYPGSLEQWSLSPTSPSVYLLRHPSWFCRNRMEVVGFHLTAADRHETARSLVATSPAPSIIFSAIALWYNSI
jgi:hypothetical protein